MTVASGPIWVSGGADGGAGAGRAGQGAGPGQGQPDRRLNRMGARPFLWCAILFSRDLTRARARQLFFASILYLPILFGLMALDKVRH